MSTSCRNKMKEYLIVQNGMRTSCQFQFSSCMLWPSYGKALWSPSTSGAGEFYFLSLRLNPERPEFSSRVHCTSVSHTWVFVLVYKQLCPFSGDFTSPLHLYFSPCTTFTPHLLQLSKWSDKCSRPLALGDPRHCCHLPHHLFFQTKW